MLLLHEKMKTVGRSNEAAKRLFPKMHLLYIDSLNMNVLLKGESETKPPAHEPPAKNVVESDDKILILVLHVDDETGFLESTKQILEMKAPVRVYAAASVEEAKEILKTKKVDVIVSDYQMPVENGLEFLKELRETNVDIPFILFTGMGREKVAIEALNGSVGELSLVNEKLSVVGTLTWHDVRNKLSVVAGNLFIAKDLLPQDHAVMKYLQKAEPAFDQTIQIFDRARAYEHLGVDKLSYVDVKQSCEEAVSLVHD